MGWDQNDVYYQPEAFGLQPIGQLDDPNASWSFSILSVWKHEETGKLYYGTDSGCSCPSPFEDYHSLDALTEIVSMHDFIDAVEEYYNDLAPWDYNDSDNRINWNTLGTHEFSSFKADCLDLIQKVREA